MCVVLAENDVSKWDDETGERYHFPKMYRKWLSPGMRFVYYKGRLDPKNKQFSPQRLSDLPHYFGIGRIGDIKPDDAGHLYATLTDFQKFDQAVIAKKMIIIMREFLIVRNRTIGDRVFVLYQ